MKPENIGHTMRQFIPLGGQAAAMSEIFIDKVNMQIDGGQLMQASIYCKNHEMVKTLITRGCDLDNPPQKVPALTGSRYASTSRPMLSPSQPQGGQG